MTAYMIAEVEVTDPASYEQYKPIAQATVQQYGGRFVVRGGTAESLEGEAPKRIVVLEFPTMEQARKWYNSAEYSPGIKLRQKASRSRLFLVEGV